MESILTAEVNKIIVHVTERRGHDFSGYYFSPLEKEMVLFDSFAELVMKLDKQFNAILFPQAAFAIRSFDKAEKKTELEEFQRPRTVDIYLEHSSGGLPSGIAKFVLHVLYRQNASWQGHIIWCSQELHQDFRSAVELLYLINSALDKQQAISEEKNHTRIFRGGKYKKERGFGHDQERMD